MNTTKYVNMNTTKYVIFALSMILMLSLAQPVMAASNNADFQLSAQSAASCPVGDTMITATLKNLGSEADTYTITSDSNWVTIGNEVISLEGGEDKTFAIFIKPRIDAEAGEYSITFTAESDSGKYQDSIDFVVMMCHGIDITPGTDLIESCIGDTKTVEVTFSNTGKYDETFILTAEGRKFDTGSITIASGREETAVLSIPVATREDTVTIKAQSTTSYASDSADIYVLSEGACYGIAVINIPPEINICKGDTARIVITSKNTGFKTGTFELSTDAENAYFKNDEIKLESKEVAETYLEISTEDSEIGEVDYSITVKSTDAQDIAYGKIIIEQCYGVEVSAVKDEEEICPGTTAMFEIDISNTGKKADTYTVSASKGSLSETSMTLEAKESKTVSLILNSDKSDTEDTTTTITAESERVEASTEITISMKDFDSCYGMSVSSDSDTIFADELKGYLYTLTVKNEGEFDAEYTASVEGPKWITVNPDTVSVKAGESKEIFVYASPEYMTPEGTYTINVNIESDIGNGTEKELKFSFKSEDMVAPITGEVIGDTVTDKEPADDKVDDKEKEEFPTNIITAIIIGIIIILLIIFGPELLKDDEEKEEDKEKKEEKKEEVKEKVEEDKKAEKPKAVEKKEEPKKEAEKPKPVAVKKAEVKKETKKKAEKPKAVPAKKKPAPKKKVAPAKKKEVREDRKDDIKQILDNI
ncbi:MAG: hypothetical protein U9O53_00770 [archaeon]|nr:hypothetical protein [archaeon]